jgi:hypothetical protein
LTTYLACLRNRAGLFIGDDRMVDFRSVKREHDKFRSKNETSRGNRMGMFTPYKFSRKKDGSWRIGYGLSSFLVAYGSAWSIDEGMAILDMLKKQYWRKT